MNYSELLNKAEQDGMNCAETALGRMMNMVEEETGSWPNWSDQVPSWILKNFGYAKVDRK